jgi:hypothetical protein
MNRHGVSAVDVLHKLNVRETGTIDAGNMRFHDIALFITRNDMERVIFWEMAPFQHRAVLWRERLIVSWRLPHWADSNITKGG